MAINPTFQTDLDHVSHVLYDPNNAYQEVVVIYDETGDPSYYNVDGTAYVPTVPGALVANVQYDRETKEICFTATAAGTGYAVGDVIHQVNVYDVTTNPATLLSTIYMNITQGTTLAALPVADVEPCGGTPTGIEITGDFYEDQANPGDYYYGIWTYQEDGTGPTLVFYNPDGTVAAPVPTTPVPVFSPDFEQLSTCLQATATGTGYTIGDLITRIDFYNAATQTLVSTIYYNESTQAVITPTAADLGPCVSSAGVDKEPVIMLDYDTTTRRHVEFLRTYVTDEDTGVTTVVDTTLDGLTAYVPTGTVYHYHQRFNAGGGQTLPFTDAAVVTLTPPVGADMAEIHVWGGTIVWDKRTGAAAVTATGATGFGRHADGAYFELEGVDELAAFQVIGATGDSGRIEVAYKEAVHVND